MTQIFNLPYRRAACVTGALFCVAVLFIILLAAFAIGGRGWTEHFGEDHWQTFVYMISTAGITGSLMLPIYGFWHRRILR